MSDYILITNNELYHHGIQGQKWGVRRYQNEDGTLTNAGKKRYGDDSQTSTGKNRGLSEGQKKALKVGAAVGATALLAAGGYKAHKIVTARNAQIAKKALEGVTQIPINRTTLNHIPINKTQVSTKSGITLTTNPGHTVNMQSVLSSAEKLRKASGSSFKVSSELEDYTYELLKKMGG